MTGTTLRQFLGIPGRILTLRRETLSMRVARSRGRGRAVAVGLLCAVAATVAAWSGPLLSATGGLHTSAAVPASAQAPVVTHPVR